MLLRSRVATPADGGHCIASQGAAGATSQRIILGCWGSRGLVEQRKQTHYLALHPQSTLPTSRSFSGEDRAGKRARGMYATEGSLVKLWNWTSLGSPTTASKPPKYPDGSNRHVLFCTILYVASGSLLISPGPPAGLSGVPGALHMLGSPQALPTRGL